MWRRAASVLAAGAVLAALAAGCGGGTKTVGKTCDHSKLSVRAGRTGVAAGSVYQPFEVANRSGQTCTVAGVPRVIAVDRHGRPIGPAATHEPDLSTVTGDR
jgi:hypothetical protein